MWEEGEECENSAEFSGNRQKSPSETMVKKLNLLIHQDRGFSQLFFHSLQLYKTPNQVFH